MSKPRFLLAVLLFTLVACERQADLSKTVEYSKNGISFSLPGNWNVTEDVEDDGFRYLFVETPGDAIIFVITYLKQDSASLLEHVEWTIESSVKEMPFGSRTEGSITETQKLIGERRYSGYKNEFVVSVAGIDVPHITEFFSFETKTKTSYFSSQVAVEDLNKVKDGFELVISTFKLQ